MIAVCSAVRDVARLGVREARGDQHAQDVLGVLATGWTLQRPRRGQVGGRGVAAQRLDQGHDDGPQSLAPGTGVRAACCSPAVQAGGPLAGLYGRGLLFSIGLAIFTGASLAAGLAGNDAALIAARAVQGLGAARKRVPRSCRWRC
jgi:hypothetical protein